METGNDLTLQRNDVINVPIKPSLLPQTSRNLIHGVNGETISPSGALTLDPQLVGFAKVSHATGVGGFPVLERFESCLARPFVPKSFSLLFLALQPLSFLRGAIDLCPVTGFAMSYRLAELQVELGQILFLPTATTPLQAQVLLPTSLFLAITLRMKSKLSQEKV